MLQKHHANIKIRFFLFTISFSSFSSGWYCFNGLRMQNKELDVKCVVSRGETRILRMGLGKNNSKYKKLN